MKLPTAPTEREGLFWEIAQKCLVSRNDRRAEYERLRSYYLFGTNTDSDPAQYNKIQPSLDNVSSFLFSVDTTRFGIQLGAGVAKEESRKVPAMVSRLNDKWQDSNADILFSNGIEWALVYSSMLLKLVPRGREVHPFLIEPHNFGVLREDISMLDRQEAFTHVYMTTRDQLQRDLVAHPNRDMLIARLSASPREDGQMPAGVQRIIVSSNSPLSGTMTGNVNDVLAGTQMYRPRTQEELIEMHELWVWDDDCRSGLQHPSTGKDGGWRIVTIADPSVVIYDRPAGEVDKKGSNIFLPGEHPFIQICPDPSYDYFWGFSACARLTQLQDLREHHLTQLNNLIDRNVTTPKATTGLWGAVDEKISALQNLGAMISTQDPIGKIVEFKPQIPTDLWQIIREIDIMFDEAVALSQLSKGHGDTGVRSKGQTESLLRVGSSRPKKRALIIEDSLERVATLYLKLDQAHDPDSLYYEQDGKTVEFMSSQFTNDYMVKVDGHSASPVFTEDQKNVAFALYDRGICDGEYVIDVLQPQNAQLLKQEYRRMMANKAAAMEAEKRREDAIAKADINEKDARAASARTKTQTPGVAG